MSEVNEREKSCEERIEGQQKSRLEHIENLMHAANGDFDALEQEELEGLDIGAEFDDHELQDERGLEETAQERLYELPLSVESKHHERILLSTGGPGDWIDVEYDSDGDVVGASYHFQDWFDHAERELHGDELKLAEEFADRLGVTEQVRMKMHGDR